MRKAGIAAAMVAMTAVTGCASIFTGTTQKAAFDTAPSGAKITISDRAGNVVHSGETPFTVRLKRGAGFMRPQHYSVKFEKEGFVPKEVALASGPNGWVFGNILIGGLVGVVIDGASGAMFAVSPGSLSVPLEAQSVSVSVQDVSTLTPEQRARLTPIG